ncbi:MAG: helix-turn-helix transcriptional regulator [[Eubacterium] siraeum]|jgi:transcriptional regulator with XRE-family HTH domain|uniref:Anaerobic benzoate catabolism transcriptional regulator n=1 Tax=[Eubacterium] siraeum TaxID=39492 RepID=A0A174ZZY8_9FIRM|nr:anaerobic benzoate catabolism transcriptional regulator [[Eubacterium] siraeum]
MREYLISLRTEKGLTQKQIAQKLDISESYYNQIEKGERQKKMDITLLNRLSLALEIPITVLINYENKL